MLGRVEDKIYSRRGKNGDWKLNMRMEYSIKRKTPRAEKVWVVTMIKKEKQKRS